MSIAHAKGAARRATRGIARLNAVSLCVTALGCGANASNPQGAAPLSPTGAPVSVVIAAVELQFEDPSPGGQSVWLANRGTSDQDISCWRITAASSGVTAFVSDGTLVRSGRALKFSTPPRMMRSPDMVTLADRSGRVLVRTPELSDSAGDDQLWYLLPGEPWRFGRSRLPEAASDGRLVSACP
jgi:hypothetical protein